MREVSIKLQKDDALEAGAHSTLRNAFALSGAGLTRDVAPAVAVLAIAVIFSLFFGRHEVAWAPAIMKAVFRFFRITLVLCLPLSVLLPVYRLIINRNRKAFLHVGQTDLAVRPLTHWLFRPFQGIGIAFLFRAKLFAMLQLVGGPASLLKQGGGPGVGRFLLTSVIIACASLLLSTLWTLDDMGIRYLHRRDQELKMVGKYVGTVMPIVFGTYGLVGLMADYTLANASLAVLKAVLILYPPFACFAVLHARLIRARKGFAAKRSVLGEGGVWRM